MYLRSACYWFPNPFGAPQSGQSHVMALQDIPQMFSNMQSWQIAKPQRQVQQKGTCLRQQWHSAARARRCLRWYGDLTEESDMIAFDAAIHHNADAGGREQGGGFSVFNPLLHPERFRFASQGLVGMGHDLL